MVTAMGTLAALQCATSPIARIEAQDQVLVITTAAKKDQRFLSMIVSRVIDGDTIEGKEVWPHPSEQKQVVRLLGINTPEIHYPGRPVERCGPEADLWVRALIPPGSYVWVENDGDLTTIDRYGRRVAYVWKGPMLVNAAIVSRGWSAAYTRFPFQKSGLFRRLEAEAHAKGMGIWSKSECADPPFPQPRPLNDGPPK